MFMARIRHHVLNAHVLTAALITVAVCAAPVIGLTSSEATAGPDGVWLQSHVQPVVPEPEPCELCTPEGWDRLVEKFRQRGTVNEPPRPDQVFTPIIPSE
jgi:hypothetical protein